MPLPIEKLNEVTTVVSHAFCADGMAAAILCKNALPHAEVQFIQYGTSEHLHLEPKPGMLFCDLSPHPSNYMSFVEAGALILDHHETAKYIVEAFGENGVYSDAPGISATHLVCQEVWEKLHPFAIVWKYEVLDFARLVGIHDTWQRDNPDWLQACFIVEALRFYPEQYWMKWATSAPSFSGQEYKGFSELGKILYDRSRQSAEKALVKAYRFTTPHGTRVAIFSGTKLTNHASDAAQQTADLVVGFNFAGVEEGVATITFSTRSGTAFDCGKLCKNFGGGGHMKAAGFSLKFLPDKGWQDPYSVFRNLLEGYEGG